MDYDFIAEKACVESISALILHYRHVHIGHTTDEDISKYSTSILLSRLLDHVVKIHEQLHGFPNMKVAWEHIKEMMDEDFERMDRAAIKNDNDPNCPYKRNGSLKEESK